MAYRTTYLFIPRNGFLCPHSSGVYLFHPLDITKTSRSLEALRLQPLGRTTAVFSMVLDLFFPKHCVHKDTARYVLSYSKPFELLSKINVDFLPKSENQATCVSFLSLNIHKSVIFLPITSEIHFCVKVFCHKLHTFASEKNKNRKI